ncbi:hypothetical protein ACFYWY_36950 [Streptomyces sp. NPDC002870]|uniref:hypothetical protein n=1 Tax=Streptomyces sp. NPDC002870 TaxID=3364666 RepID=UPI0036835AFC
MYATYSTPIRHEVQAALASKREQTTHMFALRKKIVTGAALVAAAGVLVTAAPANADSTATSANTRCGVASVRFIAEVSKFPDYDRWIRAWKKKLAAATTERDRAEAREGLAIAHVHRKEGEVRAEVARRLMKKYCH